jgi:hypothetical protein
MESALNMAVAAGGDNDASARSSSTPFLAPRP